MACACQSGWRGVLPIMGLLSLILCAAVVAYQCGRHCSPPARVEMSVPPMRFILVEPVYRPAEPNHQGNR